MGRNVLQTDKITGPLSLAQIDERDSTLRPSKLYGDSPLDISTSLATVANQAIFRSYRIPHDGYLRNVAFFTDTAAGAATVEVGVWDTGAAVAASSTNLFVVSATAGAASGAWFSVDPQLPVVAGQDILIHIASSGTTLKYGAKASLDHANVADLNTLAGLGLTFSGGNKHKLAASTSSVYGVTTAITEANLAVQVKLPVFTFQVLRTLSGAY